MTALTLSGIDWISVWSVSTAIDLHARWRRRLSWSTFFLAQDLYKRNILEPIVKPAFEGENDNDSVMQRKLFLDNDLEVFQQDGARCHTSAVTTKWLEYLPSHIKPKDWPPNSPGLSPIKNLWSILSLIVYKDPEPKNVDQLLCTRLHISCTVLIWWTQFFRRNWWSLHHFLINNGNHGPDHNQILTNIFHLTYVCTDKIL